MSGQAWSAGNRVELLENGEDFFPCLLASIAAARHELYLETFIYFADDIGHEVQAALIDAARRGVQVWVTVDGYGTAFLPDDFVRAMTDAGVNYLVYRPTPTLFGFRTRLFRRLHQKILVIDGQLALVGGINICQAHLRDYGPESLQDYAVALEGPLARIIRRHAQLGATRLALRNRMAPPAMPPLDEPARWADGASAAFVIRDNGRHPVDIERAYIDAIRGARQRVIIANAYFFPGLRLRRALRLAARRGVEVSLILQGKPDRIYARWAADSLYDELMAAGVRIHEYRERPLHAKVALVDEDWATVGSSNLDPLSLFLNLEANVMIRSPAFSQALAQRLNRLIAEHCRPVQPRIAPLRAPLRWLLTLLAYHLLRRFPGRAGWQPAHAGQTGRDTRTLQAPSTESSR